MSTTKTALKCKTDEWPVPGIQGKLVIGPDHICGKQKVTLASPSNEVANITCRWQMHLLGGAQKGLLWGATIYTDPWGEGPG